MKRDNLLDLAAKVPADLQEADEALLLYGRWAMQRVRQHRCGSAEGMYVPGAGEVQEAKREAREVLMQTADAMICQRALAKVPDVERIVLSVLYIPKHNGPRLIPPQAQLRVLGIPPRLSQERHLRGLRMFANIRGVLQRKAGAS